MERKDTLKLDEEFFLIWNFYHFRLRDEDFLDREKFGNGTWDLYWLILVYIYIYIVVSLLWMERKDTLKLDEEFF